MRLNNKEHYVKICKEDSRYYLVGFYIEDEPIAEREKLYTTSYQMVRDIQEWIGIKSYDKTP